MAAKPRDCSQADSQQQSADQQQGAGSEESGSLIDLPSQARDQQRGGQRITTMPTGSRRRLGWSVRSPTTRPRGVADCRRRSVQAIVPSPVSAPAAAPVGQRWKRMHEARAVACPRHPPTRCAGRTGSVRRSPARRPCPDAPPTASTAPSSRKRLRIFDAEKPSARRMPISRMPLLDAQLEEQARQQQRRHHQEETEVDEVLAEIGGAASGFETLRSHGKHREGRRLRDRWRHAAPVS